MCVFSDKDMKTKRKTRHLGNIFDLLKKGYTKKARPDGRAILVEIVGVEPTTPCLQSRCSSQLSYTPFWFADANMTLFFETAK